MHETLEQIKKIILWYRDKSTTATIDQLLKARDKLATYNYTIAEQFADFNKSAKVAYGIRKIGIACEVNKLTKAGETHSKADSLAIEEKKDIITEEKLNESIADSLYIKLKYSSEVVRAIEQRIAVLRKELEQREDQT